MRPAAAALALLSLAPPAGAGDLRLGLPLDCVLGETCFIQQFVDRDPGPAAQDFTCGPLVYDGHKGTDFAVPDLAAMAAGVTVRAAAPGIVTGLRDGMPDIASNAPDAPDLDGKDCGNGVAIDHGDGWVTQYCHMARGSLQVASGERVAAGTALGRVGLSGRTEFPHLHLSVRRNGEVIDPFAPVDATSCGVPVAGEMLWDPPLDYVPGGIVGLGLADHVPDYAAIKAGTAPVTLDPEGDGLVLWVHVFGTRAGDVLTIAIDGPGGRLHLRETGFDRTQARAFRASGLRRASARWPAGTYAGSATLQRGMDVVDSRSVTLTLP